MTEQFRIQGRPTKGGSQQRTAQLGVQARQHDYGTAEAAPDADLMGLVRGLEAFNPSLQRYGQQLDQFAREDGAEAGALAAEKADITGVTADAVDVPEVDARLPSAYGAEFGQAFKSATAHRLGIQAKADALDEYEKLKNTEGFDANQWMAERRQKTLAGINDPTLAGTMSKHIGQFEQGLLSQIHKEKIAKREQAVSTALTQVADDAFGPELGADDWLERSNWFMDQAKSLQMDPSQAGEYLLRRALTVSQSQNGMAELFDIFEKPQADGTSMIQKAPELAEKVHRAREQAKAQSDKFVREHTEQANAKVLMDLGKRLVTDPLSITEDELLGHLTKFGAIGSPEKAAAMYSQVITAQQKAAAAGAVTAAGDGGYLSTFKPAEQREELTRRLGPTVNQLIEGVKADDPEVIAEAAQKLMIGQSKTRSSEPVEQLQRFIASNITSMPSAAGPGAGFQAAVGVYRALSTDPKFREIYFKDDVKMLMDEFVRGQDAGTDATTAYSDAYRAISPEAKTAAEARKKDPAFQDMIRKKAKNDVTGSSFLPPWAFGSGRPSNSDALERDGMSEAISFRTRFPNASDDQVSEHMSRFYEKNYVLDENTSLAVKIPPGVNAQVAQEGITRLSKELLEQKRAEGLLTDDTILSFERHGTEGSYVLKAWDGSAHKNLGIVDIQDIVKRETAYKNTTKEERVVLGQIKDALVAGDPLPEVSPALLGKARRLNSFTATEQSKIDGSYKKQFEDRAKQIPKMSFGEPSMSIAPVKPQAGARIDKQLTASVAREFIAGPTPTHQGLAASLISVAEEVVLNRYGDPAQGAGFNIGMGYNLKANAATVDADLKAAGVPADKIEAVKDGEAELLPDQAKRLLRHTMPRYEKLAEKAANDTQPGLWTKMTPQQRAVMIDIGWQMGNPAAFKKAWGHLATGDQEKFAAETKVFFTNSKGERVEDTRRGNLRANMLAGLSTWDATLARVAGTPSSKFAMR